MCVYNYISAISGEQRILEVKEKSFNKTSQLPDVSIYAARDFKLKYILIRSIKGLGENAGSLRTEYTRILFFAVILHVHLM